MASLPSNDKLRGLGTKWLLRRGLGDRLPTEMMLDTRLSQRALERGYFDRRAIERLMDDLAAGTERQDYPLPEFEFDQSPPTEREA